MLASTKGSVVGTRCVAHLHSIIAAVSSPVGFHTCSPVVQPGCFRNSVNSVVLLRQQDQYFNLVLHKYIILHFLFTSLLLLYVHRTVEICTAHICNHANTWKLAIGQIPTNYFWNMPKQSPDKFTYISNRGTNGGLYNNVLMFDKWPTNFNPIILYSKLCCTYPSWNIGTPEWYWHGGRSVPE